MKQPYKSKEEVEKELSEYGQLHNEDCCVNFPEDSRACDVGTQYADCCENMKMIAAFLHTIREQDILTIREFMEKMTTTFPKRESDEFDEGYKKARADMLEYLEGLETMQK